MKKLSKQAEGWGEELGASPFIESVVIPEKIKLMPTLEIAERLRSESLGNFAHNWNDVEPGKCWFRQLAVELGNRIFRRIQPDTWGDWKDNISGFLTGVAGYNDHWGFDSKRSTDIESEEWDALEAFIQNEFPENSPKPTKK